MSLSGKFKRVIQKIRNHLHHPILFRVNNTFIHVRSERNINTGMLRDLLAITHFQSPQHLVYIDHIINKF